MCGLSGYYSENPSPELSGKLFESLGRITHRGPDDTGTLSLESSGFTGSLVLGSTRLAILDLTHAGHMPMSSIDNRYSVAYNGEITNFVELRKELKNLGHVFRSSGDTEVLLACWAEWGVECLPRLEGMFAFAIYDAELAEVTFARDPFGIKPFFYMWSETGDLVFSSELPGLLPFFDKKPKLDQTVAFDFVNWGVYDSSNATFIQGVNQLRPAHFMKFDLKKKILASEVAYWWPEVSTDKTVTRESAALKVRELFLDSVRRNMRSDVPVGVALSGGVDSSAIVCAVRHLYPQLELHTFSYIAEGYEKSEEVWVDAITKFANTISHKITPASNELLDDLDRMILAQGEPFGSTSIYAQFRVFELARQAGIVVTLDGQGADEIFGGYTGFPDLRLRSLIEKGAFLKARRFLHNWSSWPGRKSGNLLRDAYLSAFAQPTIKLLPAFLRLWLRKLIGIVPREKHLIFKNEVVAEYPDYPMSLQRKSDYSSWGNRLKPGLRSQLTESGLPSLLRHGDRNSMAFSIESRVPFLDVKLVEYCLSLPEEFLVSFDGETKSILREALRGVVPDAVLDRKDKIGFETPEVEWLSAYANSDQIQSAHFDIRFLDTEKTKSFLRNGLSMNTVTSEVRFYWRVLNLVRWVSLLDVDGS